MGDEQLRPEDELTQRVSSNELVFLTRIAEFERTGEHPFELDLTDWKFLWKSASFPEGASKDLVDLIDTNCENWSEWLSLNENEVTQLKQNPLVVGDRVRINNGMWWGTPPHIYTRARELDDETRTMLSCCSFAFTVTVKNDPLREKKISLLVAHKSAVSSVISESRFWRIDGSLNFKKASKVLREEVSPALGYLSERELQAIAEQWKGNSKRNAISSTVRGLNFESEVQELFIACGFNVETTAISGDFGADLIIREHEFTLAIQVKNLSSTVGVAAVQEVTAGALHYNCEHTLVVSSNGFTEAARSLARSTGTRLETLHSLKQDLHQHILTRFRN